MTARKTVTQRAAEAFDEWPPADPPSRPAILAQDAARLPVESPAEAFAESVDAAISAWAYWRTSRGTERRDALEIFAAAMDGLCVARRRYRAAGLNR